MKKFTALLLVCVLLVSAAVPASAAETETVSPRYVNTSHASVTFGISLTGVASVSVQCFGYSFATSITAKTYLEQNMGTHWSRVDLGTTDDVWTDYTDTNTLITSHSRYLPNKGQYRATTIFTVTGPERTEVFELYSTYTYS